MSKARDLANAGTALTSVSATELGYVDGVTSAIQTQLDAKTAKSTLTTTGDIYYASAANTPARLGIGSSAQVLTVASGIPSWATASSGGMTLLSTTTLSGSSTTISSISGSYNNLQLIIQNFTPSTQCAIYSRYNGDSGSNYLNVNYTLSGTSQTYGETVNTLSSDQHTSGTNLIVVDIFNYANTSTRKLMTSTAITQNNGTPNFNCIGTRGSWNSTAAITSITLYPGSGTATGTALLYGVK